MREQSKYKLVDFTMGRAWYTSSSALGDILICPALENARNTNIGPVK
jgi:hypothetical protein